MPNTTPEYFIAICQKKSHSFVAVGLVHEGVPHILASIGQLLNAGAFESFKAGCVSRTQTFFKLAFSRLPAQLSTEIDKSLANNDTLSEIHNIHYKAFSIKEAQYKAFLAYAIENEATTLETLQVRYFDKDNPQKPLSEWIDITDDAITTYIGDETSYPEKNNKHSPAYLSINNTCRHNAIALIQNTTHQTQLGQGVSSCFFKKLPLSAKIHSFTVENKNHFYILPLPPNTYENLDSHQRHVLTAIYHRLDKMIQKEGNNDVTQQKFHALKALYEEIAGDNTASILTLIPKLKDWEQNNKRLINTHRNNYRFRWMAAIANRFETSTQRFFKQMNRELENEKPSPTSP